MRVVARLCWRIVTLPVLVLATAWAMLALWYSVTPSPPVREILAVGLAGLGAAATWSLFRRRYAVVAVHMACILAVVALFAARRPTNTRDWAPDVARIATGTLSGDVLTIHNVRDFRWRSDGDFDARWEDRSYDLNRLSGVDLVMSYWSGEAIAHTILSFDFADDRHLAMSIEIRREKAETYSPIAGFFRNYELSFIAADERDVIGVRSNVRGEDVRLYHLRMPPEKARALLLAYVAEMNSLADEPQWYNSLTTNCTTQIVGMVRALGGTMPFDYRLILVGYLPDYIYERGGMAGTESFDAMKARSHIKGRAASDDPGFSAKIREGTG